MDEINIEIDSPWVYVIKPENCFELVILTRATGLLSILPFALYAGCKNCTACDRIDGVKKATALISIFYLYRISSDVSPVTKTTAKHRPKRPVVGHTTSRA